MKIRQELMLWVVQMKLELVDSRNDCNGRQKLFDFLLGEVG
jgi:hypothetical protein